MSLLETTCTPLCTQVRRSFSSYLDGAITGREMQDIAIHLEHCADCRHDFDTWRGLQRVLETVGPVRAPEDLRLKLRLAISHESARRTSKWMDSFTVRWDNHLRPMLVQISAGFASALVLVGSLVLLIGVVAAPQAVLANDEPLGAITAPHYLYSAARLQPLSTHSDNTIVVEVDINDAGRVFNYNVLSGPIDTSTAAQLRDQLLLQVYAPARVFGQPVRGQVLLTFSGVSVTARG